MSLLRAGFEVLRGVVAGVSERGQGVRGEDARGSGRRRVSAAGHARAADGGGAGGVAAVSRGAGQLVAGVVWAWGGAGCGVLPWGRWLP